MSYIISLFVVELDLRKFEFEVKTLNIFYLKNNYKSYTKIFFIVNFNEIISQSKIQNLIHRFKLFHQNQFDLRGCELCTSIYFSYISLFSRIIIGYAQWATARRQRATELSKSLNNITIFFVFFSFLEMSDTGSKIIPEHEFK